MALLVDYGLALIAVLSFWYGLGTRLRGRGIIAIGAGNLACAGLLLSLNAGYLAAVAAPAGLLGSLTALLYSSAYQNAHKSGRPSRRRSIVAAAAALSVFAALAAAVTTSEFPVPIRWASDDSAAMVGRELLGGSAFVLKTLGLTVLTVLVAGVWLTAPSRQAQSQTQPSETESTETQQTDRHPFANHRRGGS